MSVVGISILLLLGMAPVPAHACTGITLRAEDGNTVYGRTLEWGSFDLKSRLMVIPRGTDFVAATPDEAQGISWKGQCGVAGIEVLEKNALADGMNERGLVAGFFYHPGFAAYTAYDPRRASRSMGPTDVLSYLLTSFASLDEVRKGMAEVDVVPVVEPAIGKPAPAHFFVTDPQGRCIVLEWHEGSLRIFNAPLGVLTNSPTYDWHMLNLRNYVNLSPAALPGKRIEDLDFKPFGGGSGMIGLPGDFTSPSRFVRAVAFTQTARSTADGPEALYEAFRILDGFNVPLGAAEGSDPGEATGLVGMRSSTIWTCAWGVGDRRSPTTRSTTVVCPDSTSTGSTGTCSRAPSSTCPRPGEVQGLDEIQLDGR